MALISYGQKPSVIGFSANLVDFPIRYNGIFTDYTRSAVTSFCYSNEFEASLHARPINDCPDTDGGRITATGYGSLHPVADNKTKAGRAKNRRVEFRLSY